MEHITKNYLADGGDKWVVGGTLEALPDAELIGLGGGEINIVQTEGQSITDAMSQKATTDMVKDPTLTGVLNVHINTPNGCSVTNKSTNAIIIGSGSTYALSGATPFLIGGNPAAASAISPMAVGFSSSASSYATAFGNNAISRDMYAGAFGYYSKSSEASTISFGDGSTNANYGTRRLVNVRDPVNLQDAATKNYIDIRVPVPPSDGTYILKSVNGQTQWVSEEA